MGCIIRPWNLLILLMVTGVVAMAYPSDDKDVRSTAENEPEVGGVDTNKHQLFKLLRIPFRSVKERTARCGNGCTYETYTICINMAEPHFWPGTDGQIFLQVQFESGRRWSTHDYIDENLSANTNKCYGGITNRYYGNSDGVARVHIYNTSDDDGFFPSTIKVHGPGEHYRFNCNWGRQCSNSHGAVTNRCYIKSTSSAEDSTISCYRF